MSYLPGVEHALFYRVEGTGPLVVLLHGMLMEGHHWVSNGIVRQLSTQFCVAYPDLLGHGESDNPDKSSAYEPHRQVEGIIRLINELGYSKAHVMGYSSGSWLAIALAKYYPHYLSSLIIGGWDIVNGLPDQNNVTLTFDMFLSYAKTTVPELTVGITSKNEPALRACFNTLRLYDGEMDAAHLARLDLPQLFWCGQDDIYYPSLKNWAKSYGFPFLSTMGNHVAAFLKPSAKTVDTLYEFVRQAEEGNRD